MAFPRRLVVVVGWRRASALFLLGLARRVASWVGSGSRPLLCLLAVGSRCVSFVVVGDSLAMFQSGDLVVVVLEAGLSTRGVRCCCCSCAVGVR